MAHFPKKIEIKGIHNKTIKKGSPNSRELYFFPSFSFIFRLGYAPCCTHTKLYFFVEKEIFVFFLDVKSWKRNSKHL